MAGLLIAIEGIDAAGKGTQSKLLAERLKAKLFSFPAYGTSIGQLIGAHLQKKWSAVGPMKCTCDDFCDEICLAHYGDPLVFQALMTMNRYEMAGKIKAELDSGRSVVCDRYYMSGVVYAEVDGINPNYVYNNLSGFLPRPEIQLLLDIPVSEMVRRRPESRDRYESDLPGMEQRAAAYRRWWLMLSSTLGTEQFELIDGVGTIEQVQNRICKAIARNRGY